MKMMKSRADTKVGSVKPDRATGKSFLAETDIMAMLIDEHEAAEEKRRVNVKSIATAAPKVRRK